MDIGLHLVNFTVPGGGAALRSTVADTAGTAERAGLSWFTVMDHWLQMDSFQTAQAPMLEGYTTLGYVAALTEKLRLGLLVTGVTYRHPGLLAKIVTTLDVLSGGRAMLGVGAAWYEREHHALGVPYPPLAERFERLEETLQICQLMWSPDDGPYAGRHYQLAETICEPQPVTQPRPPILVGGGGEKKTLRLVARYADACNLFAVGPDEIARKLDVLRQHCEAEARDYDSITKTILALADPLDDLDGFIAEMDRYAALGVTHVQVMSTGPDPAGFAAALGDQVVPRLHQIG